MRKKSFLSKLWWERSKYSTNEAWSKQPCKKFNWEIISFLKCNEWAKRLLFEENLYLDVYAYLLIESGDILNQIHTCQSKSKHLADSLQLVPVINTFNYELFFHKYCFLTQRREHNRRNMRLWKALKNNEKPERFYIYKGINEERFYNVEQNKPI